MLCRKCKTAIVDKYGRRCGYCGARYHRTNPFLLTLRGVLCAAVIAGGFGYMYLDANGRLPDFGAEDDVLDDDDDIYDINGAPVVAQDAGVVREQAESAGDDGEEAALAAVGRALESYWYINDAAHGFITRNGYMYDYSKKAFVETKDLISAGLTESAANREYMLLFLKPAAFRGVSEADFGIGSDLKPFAAVDMTDGVMVYYNGITALVYREHFNDIMSKYITRSSEPFEPDAESPEFSGIMSMASLGESEPIVGRYMRFDGKYAAFLYSAAGDSADIRGQLLVYEDGGFVTALRRFEQYENYIERVNNAVPDADLAILPPTPGQGLYGGDKFGYITDTLAAREKVPEGDEAVYVCGTDEFVYLEYASGKKFLGVKSLTGVWSLEEYKTRSDARMAARDKAAERGIGEVPMIIPLGN